MTHQSLEQKLAELERLAKAATPGTWTSERQDQDSGDIYYAVHSSIGYDFITNFSDYKDVRAKHNAALVTAVSPAPLLSLITSIRQELQGVRRDSQTISEASNILFNLEQESGPGSSLEPEQRAIIKDVRLRLDALKSHPPREDEK